MRQVGAGCVRWEGRLCAAVVASHAAELPIPSGRCRRCAAMFCNCSCAGCVLWEGKRCLAVVYQMRLSWLCQAGRPHVCMPCCAVQQGCEPLPSCAHVTGPGCLGTEASILAVSRHSPQHCYAVSIHSSREDVRAAPVRRTVLGSAPSSGLRPCSRACRRGLGFRVNPKFLTSKTLLMQASEDPSTGDKFLPPGASDVHASPKPPWTPSLEETKARA